MTCGGSCACFSVDSEAGAVQRLRRTLDRRLGRNARSLERLKIELTPAMLEAGAHVVRSYRYDLGAPELARQVFEAMVTVWQPAPSRVCTSSSRRPKRGKVGANPL